MDSSWTPQHAAHLINRAGFGGTPAQVDQLHRMGKTGAVDYLLRGSEDADLFPVPPLTQPLETFQANEEIRKMPDLQARRDRQQELRKIQGEELNSLRTWWLTRMRYTTYPLREKMTLFWHGHFATGFDKVNSTYFVWQQNETLRAYALGDFRKMTKEISRDPAMMRYLDLPQSAKGHPNENFARELMELFTLGEGVLYTEKDVQQSARAFTGYRLDVRDGGFRFAARFHDTDPKTFMGQTGNFSGDDIIDIITRQPQSAEFITRKIWRYLAGESLPPAVGRVLAQTYYSSGLQTSALVRAILLSPEFYSPLVMRKQVKSPVQWLVQNSIVLEAPLPPEGMNLETMRRLGQMLFAPPNVKGWDGGNSWINGATYLTRCNLAGDLLSGNPRRRALPVNWDQIAPAPLRFDPDKLCDSLVRRIIAGPLPARDRARFVEFLRHQGSPISNAALENLVHLMMSTPEYQLT